MDLPHLKKLMDWAARAPIREIEIVEGDTRIHLVKGDVAAVAVPDAGPSPAEDTRGLVTSPLPGVFYLRAAPDAPPFVEVGRAVEAGQTVGLVEAMKMFNAVTCDASGTVAEILVEAGQEVVAGQPLMRLSGAGT